jgi:hypothetical protein
MFFIKTNSREEKKQIRFRILPLFSAFFRFLPLSSGFFRFLPLSSVFGHFEIGKDWKRSEKIEPVWTHLVLIEPDRNTASRTSYTFASNTAAHAGIPVARQGLTVRNLNYQLS